MRILLLKPRWFVHGGQYRYLEHVRFTPLSLGILAALSEGHEVRIVDGDWEKVPLEEDFDLVGITATTFTSERAFELADKFRARGAKVVIGGVHPSIMPDECLQHAHSAVAGEAEYVWKDVLADTGKGKLKPVYQADRLTDMNDVPMPRRDLLSEPSWFACVQATRGCPNSCKYCYLPSVPWKKFRKRSLELVQEEIRQLKQSVLFFVDDNIFADRDYAVSIFDGIAKYRKAWSIQAPTTIGDDEALLDSMARSGCFNVQIGFQSFNKKSLQWAAVDHNVVDKYRGLVEKLHKRNILATGFFMFGFDSDGPDSFEGTAEMIKQIDLDDANLYILTPYPGTAMYAQFGREGRLLSGHERIHYGWSHAVFQPKAHVPRRTGGRRPENLRPPLPAFQEAAGQGPVKDILDPLEESPPPGRADRRDSAPGESPPDPGLIRLAV